MFVCHYGTLQYLASMKCCSSFGMPSILWFLVPTLRLLCMVDPGRQMCILWLHCSHHQNAWAQSILYKVWHGINLKMKKEETRDPLVSPKVLKMHCHARKKRKEMSRPRITKVLHRDHSKKGAIIFWPLVGTQVRWGFVLGLFWLACKRVREEHKETTEL